MCDIPATFPWHITDISVFVWNFTFVCSAFQGIFCISDVSLFVFVWNFTFLCTAYVCVTYAWHMMCTRDISTAYVRLKIRYILICGVSVLYHFLFNTYENKWLCSLCSCCSVILHNTELYQLSDVEDDTGEI